MRELNLKFKLSSMFKFVNFQANFGNLKWSLIDNGFCAIFYAIQILVSVVKLVYESELSSEFIVIVLIFHCFAAIAHCFVFVCIKAAYELIKTYDAPRNPKLTTFHDEYYLEIEQRRAGLNDDYLCPKSSEAIYSEMKHRESITRDSILDRSSQHRTLRSFSSFKRDSALSAVYEDAPVAQLAYDELTTKNPNEYDTIKVLS